MLLNDLFVIHYILLSLNRIEELTSLAETDIHLFSVCTQAICFNIIRIGEAVKKLSQEYTLENSSQPWKGLAGMRDVLAHKRHIDIYEVWKTVLYDLPSIRDHCAETLRRYSYENCLV